MTKNKKEGWLAVSQKTKIWSIATFIVGLISYIILVTLVESDGWFIEMLRNVFLIGISVLGTTLLADLLIDVKKENDLIKEIGIYGLLNSKEFLSHLPHEVKESTLNLLDSDLNYGGNGIKKDMCDSIQKKISKIDDEYYYSYCSYAVDCEVHDAYIQQVITKNILLTPYEGSCTLKDFRFVSSINRSCKNNTEEQNFILEHIKIYEKKSEADKPSSSRQYPWISLIEGKDYKIVRGEVDDVRKSKNSYNAIYTVDCINKLLTSGEYGVYIETKYKLTLDKSDLQFTCSAKVPSQRLTVKYSLDDKTSDDINYILSAKAFCPFDILGTNADTGSKKNIDYTFEGWTFPGDGVAITITPVDANVPAFA